MTEAASFIADPFDDDKLKEECGVFGIIGKDIGRRHDRAWAACAPASRAGSGRHRQL